MRNLCKLFILAVGLLAAPAFADDISNGSWNTLDPSNNASPPNGWPAGMFPNQVEPSARAGMGGTKRWWERANPTLSTTGSAGAYVLTPTNASYPTAYTQGEFVCAKANFASVGGDTLNFNGLGAKKLYSVSATGVVQLTANALRIGQQFCGSYDAALNSAAGGFQILGGVFQPGGLLAANNLSDVASAATSRTNLGLGTAAVLNTGTSGGTIPLLNGTNVWSGTQQIANTGPQLQFNETDQALPAGLFRFAGQSGAFSLQRNTAVAGDFSTNTTPLSFSAGDVATFLNPPVFTSAPLALAQGGTAATSAAAARTSLGLGTAATAASTSFAQVANNLSDLASVATARTNLGLGALATLATINNANWSGTDLAIVNGGTGASDAATARTNLGEGTASVQDIGTSGANVPLMSTANTWSALQTFSSGISFSGSLTLSGGATITPSATPATTEVGYLGTPQNIQNASYGLVLTDRGKMIYHSSASAHTYTIPANSSVAFPIGTKIEIVNDNGGGNITIAITTDTLRLIPAGTTGSRTLSANGTAVISKITATVWQITGVNLT